MYCCLKWSLNQQLTSGSTSGDAQTQAARSCKAACVAAYLGDTTGAGGSHTAVFVPLGGEIITRAEHDKHSHPHRWH